MFRFIGQTFNHIKSFFLIDNHVQGENNSEVISYYQKSDSIKNQEILLQLKTDWCWHTSNGSQTVEVRKYVALDLTE